jgi:DNA-binding NarL/FixJ family response regulator
MDGDIRHLTTQDQSTSPTRVALFDRNVLLAESLAMLLKKDPDFEVVAVEHDTPTMARRMQSSTTDVLVISFPLLRDIKTDALPAILATCPSLKILVLATTDDEETLTVCLRAGAHGCVLMGEAPGELARSIKQVHGGEVRYPPGALVNIIVRSQNGDDPSRSTPAPQRLAAREAEVLQTLAAGASTEEAAQQLGITVHTVRSHLRHAMTKLSARSKLEAVILALKDGLIQLPE